MLSDKTFADWSKDYVVFCHITTHVETDKHQDLLSKKGGAGFPHMVFMDHDGNVMAMHRAERSLDGFTATAMKAKETAKTLATLKSQAAGGDLEAKKQYFMKRFDLGHFAVGDAIEAMKGIDFSDDERKSINAKLASLEVNEIMGDVTEDEATQIRAGKRFFEMMKAGRKPSGLQEGQAYWILMMVYAESEKDAKLYETALNGLRELFSDMLDNPGVANFLQEKEKTLKKLMGEDAEGIQ